MDGVAEWNGSEDAKYYELRVYRDEKFLSTVKPGKKNEIQSWTLSYAGGNLHV